MVKKEGYIKLKVKEGVAEMIIGKAKGEGKTITELLENMYDQIWSRWGNGEVQEYGMWWRNIHTGAMERTEIYRMPTKKELEKLERR